MITQHIINIIFLGIFANCIWFGYRLKLRIDNMINDFGSDAFNNNMNDFILAALNEYSKEFSGEMLKEFKKKLDGIDTGNENIVKSIGTLDSAFGELKDRVERLEDVPIKLFKEHMKSINITKKGNK